MKIQDAFPSPFLKASDVGEQGTRFTMADVVKEEVGIQKDSKFVLYFRGQKKGLVLNKINMRTIAKSFGDEMDNWAGNEVILYSTMVEFQGDMVEGIRVKHVPAQQAAPQKHTKWVDPGPVPGQPAQVPAAAVYSEPPASIVTEAEAITRGGIDRFRDWRDRLSEAEIEELRPHMTRLIQMASAETPPPKLSEAAKKITQKGRPDEKMPF